MDDQEKRTVLIAGGSGAVGGAIGRALGAQDWNVLLGYRSGKDAAEEHAQTIRDNGGEASTLQLDLSDADDAEAVLREVCRQHRLHGLVYAAGPAVVMKHISKVSAAEYQAQLIGDAGAFFNLVKPCLEALRETQGAILATTTTALARYSVKDVLSVAPKAAIEVTVRGIAAEEGRFGVRANCVGIGVIQSGLWDSLMAQGAYSEEFLEAARRNIALRRFGTEDDVAAAAAYLMSPAASWVTGQTINVDGGYAL